MINFSKHDSYGFRCLAVFCLTFLIFASSFCEIGFAQRPTASVNTLGVDEVRLHGAKRMYGINLNRTRNEGDGVSLMVERAWFKKTYPDLYAEHLKVQAAEAEASSELLIKRLKAWKKERAEEERVIEFVDAELDFFADIQEKKRKAKKANEENVSGAKADQASDGKAKLDQANESGNADEAKKANEKPADGGEPANKNDEETFFTIVKYKPGEIKSIFQQPPNHIHIAGVAWKHEVPRVTVRNVKTLLRELEKKKIEVGKETFDFSEDIPAFVTQTEEEWAARVAILEYGLRDEPYNFQGMGSNLIRIDPNKPPKAEDVLNMFGGGLGGGLGGALGGLGGGLGGLGGLGGGLGGGGLGGGLGGGGEIADLLKELKLDGGKGAEPKQDKQWWKSATKTAEDDGVRGIRITRVVQNSTSPVAKVEDYFFAMIKPGQWKPVLSATGSANRKDVREEDIVRLKADPRIAGVLEMVEKFGLGSGIDTALRQGAATEMAMHDSHEKFFELLGTYSERSDGPPLEVK